MDFGGGAYVMLYVVSALVPCVAAAHLWPQRSLAAGRWLIPLLVTAAFWSLTKGLASVAVTLPTAELEARLSYAACTTAPVFLMLFALDYSGRVAPLSPPRALALFVLPILAAAAVFTNGLHHAIWTSVSMSGAYPGALVFVRGPLYLAATLYGLGLALAATVILLDAAAFGRDLHRIHHVGVAVGAMIPWVAELLYTAAPVRFQWFDPSLAVGIGATVIGFVMVRHRLLDLAPGERAGLLGESLPQDATMPDGLLVVNRSGRIVDANYTARRILSCNPASPVGVHLSEALHAWPSLAEAIAAAGEATNHFVATSPRGEYARVETWALRDRAGRVLGKAVLLHDVSPQQSAGASLSDAQRLDGWAGVLEERDRVYAGCQ